MPRFKIVLQEIHTRETVVDAIDEKQAKMVVMGLTKKGVILEDDVKLSKLVANSLKVTPIA